MHFANGINNESFASCCGWGTTSGETFWSLMFFKARWSLWAKMLHLSKILTVLQNYMDYHLLRCWNVGSRFFCFVTMHACDGQTDKYHIAWASHRADSRQRYLGAMSLPNQGAMWGECPQLETNFGIFWRTQNALFCIYKMMLWVRQTVFHVTFGGQGRC